MPGRGEEIGMIAPDNFYDPTEKPSDKLKKRMWNAIQREIIHPEKKMLFILDRTSFVYGAIASLALVFTCVGIYATMSRFIDSSKPESIRLESAYESAIRQFERFVPAAANAGAEDTKSIWTRKEQLTYLDAAIGELKRDLNGNDLSPLKRARLRQLYSVKLAVLQEMIEKGEIEL
jgi:hypothetical protein